MARSFIFLVLAATLLLCGRVAGAEPGSGSPPLTYELMINGESFLVQADRQERLASTKSPGVHYDVALRIAMDQPVTLNSMRFEYQWPAQVDDDHGRARRTVRIRHELGYSLLVTDLGPPPASDAEDQELKTLSDSVVAGLRQSGNQQIEVAPPHTHQFPAAAGRGVVIRYRDSAGYDHTCLVYLLIGKGFAASCVAQYFDRDADAVIPSLRKTIESVGPIR